MTEPDRLAEGGEEAVLQRLGRLAHEAGDHAPDELAHARSRERFVSALERTAVPRPRRRWLGPAAVIAAAALVLLALRLRPEPPLGYAIDGAPAEERYVRGGAEGAAARFSEGTVIGFAPGARGRITAVSARGARVSLEEGRAHFQVTHLPHAAWTAEAGPFTVEVTGTDFDLAWQDERFTVVMHSGSVLVRGPLASGGIALHAGQQLAASAARGELSISEAPGPIAPPTPIAESAREAPIAAPIASATASTAASAPSHAASAEGAPIAETARERLARGDFAGVIAEAEARGLDRALDGSPLADLAALADAARYAGRGELARRALLAERARFPGSAEARSAAFLLGRMDEAGSPAAAIAWYDRYLVEAPDGSLAAEALGRKMVATKASAGPAAARPIAEIYLRRFPRGAFAQAASALLAER
jgi:hypothetical protein